MKPFHRRDAETQSFCLLRLRRNKHFKIFPLRLRVSAVKK